MCATCGNVWQAHSTCLPAAPKIVVCETTKGRATKMLGRSGTRSVELALVWVYLLHLF